MKNLLRKCSLVLSYVPLTALAMPNGNLPWENVLNKIVLSLTGPVAYSIAIIAIVSCGFTMAFTDLQGGSKRLLQAACGLSIVFFATQIVTGFLGFSGN